MWHNYQPFDTTKLTVELHEIVESGVNIWDFEYPSYYKDEAKKEFEQKVIDHYFTRQIGQETVGRWLHYFRTRIREIMPFYIQLYESEELMKSVENPFEAYDLREEYTETVSGSESSSNTSDTSTSGTNSENQTTSNTNKFHDTPQGSIENLGDYLTNATLDNGTNQTQGTSSATGSVTASGESEHDTERTYTLTRKGNIGVQPLGVEIEAYRKALINIDMMIINELNDLFLKVY